MGLAAGLGTAVARPQLGVLGRVLRLALDDPRVEGDAVAGLLVEPLGPHVAPRATGRDLPVAEELGDATGLEHRADLADERPDEGVAGTATVAVLVEREALVARRDDEGRVADDEREPLSCNGIEQVTREQLDLGDRARTC